MVGSEAVLRLEVEVVVEDSSARDRGELEREKGLELVPGQACDRGGERV